MLSLDTLLGKKGSVEIQGISIFELEQEPLPNDKLHHVKTTFQLDGFEHYLFFVPRGSEGQPHPEISGPYLVLQQHAKSRSWEEIEAMEGKSVIEIIRTNHRIHPLYTDRAVHTAAAKELEDVLGAAPAFYEIMDQKTGRLQDASCEAEIWSCINLKRAIYRSHKGLAQREIAHYITKLLTSQILQKVSLESAYYKMVSRREFDKWSPVVREKATFYCR